MLSCCLYDVGDSRPAPQPWLWEAHPDAAVCTAQCGSRLWALMDAHICGPGASSPVWSLNLTCEWWSSPPPPRSRPSSFPADQPEPCLCLWLGRGTVMLRRAVTREGVCAQPPGGAWNLTSCLLQSAMTFTGHMAAAVAPFWAAWLCLFIQVIMRTCVCVCVCIEREAGGHRDGHEFIKKAERITRMGERQNWGSRESHLNEKW